MMKIFIFLLSSILLLPSHKGRGPEISPPDVFDYGTITYKSSGIGKIPFTNTGDEPLLINCKSSCGCLIPSWPKSPLMPGQTDTITIQYLTERLGYINKAIYVNTNEVDFVTPKGDTIFKSYNIRILGMVIKPENMPEQD